MNNFAKLAADERRAYVEETANRRNSTDTAIEKDFWSVGHYDTFSLSKVSPKCALRAALLSPRSSG